MSRPIRLLHFADAHIDIANYGRHDPESGLPMRVQDFLQALDQVITRAIEEPVDLIIFAGDAYKDRNPQPTFQREWGRRIMQLSAAGIPTVLLVGNHDVSPATGRAHTLQEFATLQVPNIHVAATIDRLEPETLGLPVQIVTIPWASPSRLMTRQEMSGLSHEAILTRLESLVAARIERLIDDADPQLPLILTAHASVQGAKFGSERQVMLGQELVLSGRVVGDRRLDYVALGHIHRHQELNEGQHPPVVYPGSIERIDFGEVRERKGFILADVDRNNSSWQFVPLETRPFRDFDFQPESPESLMSDIMAYLPDPARIAGAVCRLRLTYPRDWEPLIDEAAIHEHFAPAFGFHIQKHIMQEQRARLGDILAVEKMSPAELLETYWRTIDLPEDEVVAMQALVQELFTDDEI